jgi:hypothetical protein
MAPSNRTLTLKPKQRDELEFHRDHDPKPYVRERAAALLKVADGMSPHAVAQHGLYRPAIPMPSMPGWTGTKPMVWLGFRSMLKAASGVLPWKALATRCAIDCITLRRLWSIGWRNGIRRSLRVATA